MMDVAIVGAVWGLGLWVIYFGYFTTQCPKTFKRWVYAKRYRIFILDLVIVFLGNMIINKASGSVTAGIGTFVLAFASFAASIIMMMSVWAKRKIYGLFGGSHA